MQFEIESLYLQKIRYILVSMTYNTKLSIIVPVYNVEKYIRDCILSIFRQGLNETDFEVIIVNDGTEDNSMSVISDVISQHKNIIVINQENQSLSVARNNGVTIANGEYIFMPDSDDLLVDGSLKPLLDIAIKTKVDLIVADFIELNDDEIECVQGTLSSTKDSDILYQEMTGREMYIKYLHPSQCYVWRTLYKKSFLINNNLSFIPGIRFQDIPFTSECHLLANKCIKTSILLYIYRQRRDSATFLFDDKKANDNIIAIAKTWELISKYQLSGIIKEKLQNNIFTNLENFSKRIFHLSKDLNERERFFAYLRQNAPDMYFANTMKQRFISYFFWHYPLSYNYTRYYSIKIFDDRIKRYCQRICFIINKITNINKR